MSIETWDLWYPKAGATGLSFARGRLDATEALLAHAAPDFITVEVRDDAGRRIAFAPDLERTLRSPICLLRKQGDSVTRGHLADGARAGAAATATGRRSRHLAELVARRRPQGVALADRAL